MITQSQPHQATAICPSPYQLTSSRSNRDPQNPTDLCPYLKSTTAFPPAARTCSAMRRLTSSRCFNWAEMKAPPISTRIGLMILVAAGRPSTNLIPSNTVMYTSSLHNDDNLVALTSEGGDACGRHAFEDPSLLRVGVQGSFHLLGVELAREPFVFLRDDLVFTLTVAIGRTALRGRASLACDRVEDFLDIGKCRFPIDSQPILFKSSSQEPDADFSRAGRRFRGRFRNLDDHAATRTLRPQTRMLLFRAESSTALADDFDRHE